MRIDKFTQKMQEALQAAQDLASQANHPEITNEHFLSALLDQGEGITRPLLEKIGVQRRSVARPAARELERRPKVHGTAVDLRISNELRSVLDRRGKGDVETEGRIHQRRALLACAGGRERSRAQNY